MTTFINIFIGITIIFFTIKKIITFILSLRANTRCLEYCTFNQNFVYIFYPLMIELVSVSILAYLFLTFGTLTILTAGILLYIFYTIEIFKNKSSLSGNVRYPFTELHVIKGIIKKLVIENKTPIPAKNLEFVTYALQKTIRTKKNPIKEDEKLLLTKLVDLALLSVGITNNDLLEEIIGILLTDPNFTTIETLDDFVINFFETQENFSIEQKSYLAIMGLLERWESKEKVYKILQIENESK